MSTWKEDDVKIVQHWRSKLPVLDQSEAANSMTSSYANKYAIGLYNAYDRRHIARELFSDDIAVSLQFQGKAMQVFDWLTCVQHS